MYSFLFDLFMPSKQLLPLNQSRIRVPNSLRPFKLLRIVTKSRLIMKRLKQILINKLFCLKSLKSFIKLKLDKLVDHCEKDNIYKLSRNSIFWKIMLIQKIIINRKEFNNKESG